MFVPLDWSAYVCSVVILDYDDDNLVLVGVGAEEEVLTMDSPVTLNQESKRTWSAWNRPESILTQKPFDKIFG